jgi:hypothetical protein
METFVVHAKLAVPLIALGFSLLVLSPASCSRARPIVGAPVGYPYATIANDHLRLFVYLPDPAKGFYRGPRFDWSGQVARAEFAGHTAFAEWATPHDPLANDYVVGPAEEFGMDSPLGYEEAAPGQPFYKIGVGALERADSEPYKFWGEYRLLDAPPWTVTTAQDRIEFVQELAGERGWAYAYTKRIVLDPSCAAFTIEHVLRNTGTKTIDTTHYAHDFVILDDEPIGPAYRMTYPFVPTIEEGSLKEAAEFEGNTLVYTAPLTKAQVQWVRLGGFESKPEHHHVTVANTKSGARLTIYGSPAYPHLKRAVSRVYVHPNQGRLSPVKIVYYAVRTAACPEFFVSIHVAPGEALEWSNTYAFEVAAAEGE